jgi:hypothetical protein
MNKKIYYIVASILLVVLIAAAAAYVLYKPNNNEPKKDGSITVIGTVGCLTPKDNTGIQDLSCAIGLKADNGKSYALGADDPTITGSIPGGQKVEVTGVFTEQSSRYDSAGIIQVTTVKRL